ncbi:MAG: S-methyl-5-thioribose-1-phosphate isomerase [Acidaminococcales bacterium]|jgi:methylthioribose-1-phosphate isomerase|nr:S-methyl-5-thioribose-1-phosphate isomerase [Acidaminococcales bacterium]
MNALEWQGDSLKIIDQTKLPLFLSYIVCSDYERIVQAIRRLEVRGAPAIGACAAFALVLAARKNACLPKPDFLNALRAAKVEIAGARPTAVNLFWALERVWRRAADNENDVAKTADAMEAEAVAIFNEDIAANKKIGEYGAAVLPEKCAVLTHCNAGALATCGWGTALGVIRAAFSQGKITMVYADETRPLLQGARITAWELVEDNIPVTLVTDSTAGWVMKKDLAQVIITGADRIALNGDTANKIGTFTLAVLAKRHNIPFYIAAPVSTIDFSIKTGEEIPIEERAAEEVRSVLGASVAPETVKVFNPAFDVTPNELISAIITEKGLLYPPYEGKISSLKE